MLLDSPVVSFETRHGRFTHSSLHKDVGYYDNELFQSLACMDENFAYLMKTYRGTILCDVMEMFPLMKVKKYKIYLSP